MNKKIIIPNNLSKLATYYRERYPVFIGWLQLYPDVWKELKPYRDNNKKSLPPKVIKKITDTLGNPEE